MAAPVRTADEKHSDPDRDAGSAAILCPERIGCEEMKTPRPVEPDGARYVVKKTPRAWMNVSPLRAAREVEAEVVAGMHGHLARLLLHLAIRAAPANF